MSLSGPTEVLRAPSAALLTPPAAFDGVVYVAVLNARACSEPNVSTVLGGNIGTMDGQMVALDATTGAILWDVVNGDPMGGATVLNDLVLTRDVPGYGFDHARPVRPVGRGTRRAASTRGRRSRATPSIVWPIRRASGAAGRTAPAALSTGASGRGDFATGIAIVRDRPRGGRFAPRLQSRSRLSGFE